MLLEKVIQNRKIKSAEKFKKISEESYNWFNSDEFLDMFNASDKVFLIYSIQEDFTSRRQFNNKLPFTDSEGRVDLVDIEEYLTGQGFDTDMHNEQRPFSKWTLVIKLPKGE